MTATMIRIGKSSTPFGFPGERYRCPKCNATEVLTEGVPIDLLSHRPGSVDCRLNQLQNQVNDLQSTVGAIVDKMGGEL